MIELLLIALSIFFLLHYLYFLLRIYYGLNNVKNQVTSSIPDEFVSIIVPFRNEAENILDCYNSLVNQDYPENKYEIIFVDDISDDNSFMLLKESVNRNNVRLLSVPESYSINAHKKRAVRFGIENSSGKIIVTTDADCTHKNNWLSTLLSFLDGKTGFVSGPVEFEKGIGIFAQLQKLEFSGLVITGAGLIGNGNPTICNAANIAYRKDAYNQVNGFTYQMNLSSGDDELLMQKIDKDTEYKVRFAFNEDAVVKTLPNQSLSDFYQQRKRWASKGLFYNNKLLISKLIFIYLFYLSIPINIAAGIIYSKLFLIIAGLSLLFKIIIEYIILKKGSGIFKQHVKIPIFLMAEIFQIPYIIIAGISGALGNYTWKNRKVAR